MELNLEKGRCVWMVERVGLSVGKTNVSSHQRKGNACRIQLRRVQMCYVR